MRVLIIEDEPDIATALKRGLERERYAVEVVSNGSQGLERASEGLYAVIILDLMLPGMDGLQVCAELRERQIATPILMLTARDAVDDRVKGLEIGADDYLPKPFEMAEILARVRALQRRDRLQKGRVLRVGDLAVDTGTRRVTRGAREIMLTNREYTLLEALAARPGQVFTREAILERVWMDEESYSNTVDVYIGMLRKKIDAGQTVKLLRTVIGVGYTLRDEEGTEG